METIQELEREILGLGIPEKVIVSTERFNNLRVLFTPNHVTCVDGESRIYLLSECGCVTIIAARKHTHIRPKVVDLTT